MRRGIAEKKELLPDTKYDSKLIGQFINMVMVKGKKSVAERIVYKAFDIVIERTNKKDVVEIFQKAVNNIRPLLAVKSRRVGGATYQVPEEVRPQRGVTLALRWIRNYARERKGKPMEEKLADEILDAYKGTGNAIKKKEDTHKMAEANKAFAHYRW